MTIDFQTNRVVMPVKKNLMIAWLTAALPQKQQQGSAQLTVRFVGSAEGQQLNWQYREKNYPTNVLTFGYSARPLHADLVLCMPVVRREARERKITIDAHLAHLLVHGCLHAQGYDHDRPARARIMEAKERQILRHFGIADPYRLAD